MRTWTGNHQAAFGREAGDSMLTQCPGPGQALHGCSVPTTCSQQGSPGPWPEPTGMSCRCPGQAPLGAHGSLLRFPLWYQLGIGSAFTLCPKQWECSWKARCRQIETCSFIGICLCPSVCARAADLCWGMCEKRMCGGRHRNIFQGDGTS